MNTKTRKDPGNWNAPLAVTVGLSGRRRPLRRWRTGALMVAPALLVLGLPSLGGQAASQPSITAVTMSNCPNGMTKVTDGLFRVFACNDGPTAATDEQEALTDLQDLYLPETGLMGPPVPDFQVPHENGRIDVYLVTTGQTVTREGDTTDLAKLGNALGAVAADAINGSVSSGYIVALRPESLPAGLSFNSTLAHEFFHVLEDSHNTTASCPGFWFVEAAAKWAEWYFAPTTAGAMVYPFVSQFQAKPGVSLTDVSLTDPAKHSPYDDWMWPLYMQQQAGAGSIANAWTAMEGKTGCDALNAAVYLQLPFSTNFGDFSVENFDSQLVNTVTKVKAWPVNFGPDYPDFSLNLPQNPPEFPQIKPKHGTYTGYTNQTVPVNLPPLSAQYTKVSIPALAGINGGMVAFDFSGLAPAGHLWVSLLAEDYQGSGYATNNGIWERIDLPGGDNKAQICLNADATKAGKPLGSNFYAILANADSGPSAAPITGSYTIKPSLECAAALSGTLTINETTTAISTPVNFVTTQNATINVSLIPSQSGAGWQSNGGSWSEQYKQTGPCLSGTGTYTITANGSGSPLTSSDLALSAYVNTYSSPPYIGGDPLVGEWAQGTKSGQCGSGPVSVAMYIINSYCPKNLGPGLVGAYTSQDAGINFGCSFTYKNSYGNYKIQVGGTLTATDPVPCGLWTSNCSIGSRAMTRNTPAEFVHRK